MPAWLGALGQMGTTSLPQQEPFVWGQGGARMSPEQLAQERAIAEQMLAQGADYSPVGHWTQGLARASQGVLGGLRMAKTRDASAANAEQGDMIAQALMGGGGDDIVAAALMDPNTPKPVRDFAEMKYRAANRPPPQPGEFERALEASGVLPGSPEYQAAMVKRRDNMLDPMASVPLPGGQVYLGPRSGLADVLGGGAPPVDAVPPAPVGKLTPIQGGASPAGSRTFR